MSDAQAVALDKIATTKLKLGAGGKYLGKANRFKKIKDAGIHADVKDVSKSAFNLIGM